MSFFHHKKWIISSRLKFIFDFFNKFDLPIFYIFFRLFFGFIPVLRCFLPTIVFNHHCFQVSTQNCTMNLIFLSNVLLKCQFGPLFGFSETWVVHFSTCMNDWSGFYDRMRDPRGLYWYYYISSYVHILLTEIVLKFWSSQCRSYEGSKGIWTWS